jgi:hypothetical protein
LGMLPVEPAAALRKKDRPLRLLAYRQNHWPVVGSLNRSRIIKSG